ncbi:hypothetical protein [Devosia naphthalenivorans]|uniref:hypothetical protein n=1 Tax=Devosia naphthalenivorans TaxID=2082392 RepID=UPI000D344C11|nr:hypothetical protein [Devosia naphthalenivorans]
MQVLQIVQALGSAAGLLSALYLGWQFITRRLPAAVIVVRKAYEFSPAKTHFLRIKNPSDRPMIVRFGDNIEPTELRVILDDSIRAAVVAAMGESVEVVIDAEEATEFRLARRTDHETIDPENHVFAQFAWRYPQPFVWQLERRQRVQMRRRDYDALIADPLRDDDL